MLALGACSSEAPTFPVGSGDERAEKTSTNDGPPDDPSVVDASAPAEEDERDALAPGAAAITFEPCATKTPVCPPTSASEGGGLVAIDRCAFPMLEASSFETLAPIVVALTTRATKVPLTTVLGDLNRSGTALAASAVPGDPSGVALAFGWRASDSSSSVSTATPKASGSPSST